ncbi:MAG: PEP-utilizing enzyme [Solirubrobacteraceae bacterium]|nr:PEP-utilizing enzyme [Solirubrobacteraceae bacterium]
MTTPQAALVDPATVDVLDPIRTSDAFWTTTNFGEAVPGVLTALNWSFWSGIGERAVRRTFRTVGTLTEPEDAVPPIGDERFLGVFHGRIAGNVTRLGEMGDRIPGASGADVAVSMFGELPEGFTSDPTKAYALRVLRRTPPAFLSIPRNMARIDADTATWWASELAAGPTTDIAAARARFRRAQSWFDRALYLQILNNFVGVTPVYDQVNALAAAAGDPELAGRLLAGQGSHAELAVVEGLWAMSRDRMTVEAFVAEHGFHGPMEGEISARVWREDPSPVLTLVEHYRRRPESESPDELLRGRAADREAARREVLRAVGLRGRAKAELVLWLAQRYNPTRGLGKAAFLRSLDVARAAARQTGEALVRSGALDDPDDVFHLTMDELLTVDPSSRLQDHVAARRTQRDAHAALSMKSAWRGRPDATAPVAQDRVAAGTTLTGTGVSNGVVEGPVRVVLDPDFDDVEDGEILVAPFTDPSWASIMYCSAALVVEVGGAMSHAAVVARELGLPCVMGLEDVTSQLRTGDVVRVDGHAGTIEVLTAAAE